MEKFELILEYVSPQLEVINVSAEGGFAASYGDENW